MTFRVLRTYFWLNRNDRLRAGLSLFGAMFNLPSAYRIASGTLAYYRAMPYADWVERFDALSANDRCRIRKHIRSFSSCPHFHVVLLVGAQQRDAVEVTVSSLREQLYRHFTLSILDFTSVLSADFDLGGAGINLQFVPRDALEGWVREFNDTLADRRGDECVILLRSGDALPDHALYWFAWEVLAQPDAPVVYSDDDSLDAQRGRCDARFKPDWSLEHLRSTDYIGQAVVLRAKALAAAGGVSLDWCRYGNYDLLLQIVDAMGHGAGKIAHVPAVLFHRGYRVHPHANPPPSRARENISPSLPGEGDGDRGAEESAWYKAALQAHLARRGIHADVLETQPGCRRIRYRLPDSPPLVSIIVPTRDALSFLRQCVGSVLGKTTYPRFEVLIVDNQSAHAETHSYFEQISRHAAVRILPYDRPFNYSAINNFAARQARGPVLCMLNNDTEVMSPDWLDELVGHLLQPGVGVVGAKLYYPDGHVQHAGDIVGLGGCANHLHAFVARDDAGYCSRALVAQELSAVTAACFVTWRDLFVRIGGLDERRLKVAFNDTDYCLRVREAGYRVVWTPHAELVHHESTSRGVDQSWRRRLSARREVATMRRRWGHVMQNDPFYNPNLSYEYPDLALSRVPRVAKPWMG
jgi:GT2 family glycosyltransferase